MKKIWKMRKDGKAVSPVIATILMVAITVVLAAVLYVMVMGFGGSNNQQTPTATMTYTKTTATSYTFTIAGLSRNDVKATDVTMKVNVGSTAAVNVTHFSSPNLMAGDTIVVTTAANSIYTLTMVYEPTGAAIYQVTWTAS